MRVINQLGEKMAAAMAEVVPDAEIIEVRGNERAPDGTTADALLASFGRDIPIFGQLDDLGVKWVHLPSTGVDSYPLEQFRGHVVTCSRGASAVPIAEFVLAAMLAFEKRLPDVWLDAPPEHWNWANLGGLAGRTLGVVGLGSIGTAIAARALPFDMRVLAVRRTDAPSPVDGVEVLRSVDDLLPEADHLVVAAPATSRTAHLLDAEAFDRVKPGVHLVNIARGTLVDQDALRKALDDERVALATLDVADPEPVPEGHWLYAHPKVRLSAHVSWSSPAMLDMTTQLFLENLRRFAGGEPLEGVVDLDEGY